MVITGLTRNQFGSNPTRVRIPHSPPKKSSKQAGLLDFLFCFLENKWSESTTVFADLNFNFQYSIDFRSLPNQEEKVHFPLLVQKEKKVAAELQLHSDQGSQYTSQAYYDLTQEYGITPSMSRRGNCYDNAMAENFFSIL